MAFWPKTMIVIIITYSQPIPWPFARPLNPKCSCMCVYHPKPTSSRASIREFYVRGARGGSPEKFTDPTPVSRLATRNAWLHLHKRVADAVFGGGTLAPPRAHIARAIKHDCSFRAPAPLRRPSDATIRTDESGDRSRTVRREFSVEKLKDPPIKETFIALHNILPKSSPKMQCCQLKTFLKSLTMLGNNI